MGKKERQKHTPGPWEVDGGYVVTEERGHQIAHWERASEAIGPDEGKANAHLIAAAPDLLEAVKMNLGQHGLKMENGEFVDCTCIGCDNSREVIAKAEAKS